MARREIIPLRGLAARLVDARIYLTSEPSLTSALARSTLLRRATPICAAQRW